MTTPDTIDRRRLCADCGELHTLAPFEGALLCQACADRRWDAAIDAEAARLEARFERATLGSWRHP